MSTHGFDLGSLDLASGLPHEDGYTLSVLGNGATFGQSQAVVRQIVSMLADGDLVSYDRSGNRVAEFDVLIEGADGVALQAGEVALRRELYRPNVVTWTPPADFSAPTVFEVVTSEMAPKFDDIDELRTRRVFHVTLTCAPHAQSANPVTIPALSVVEDPVIATVTNADTTSGWSATISGYVGVSPPVFETNPVTVTDQGSYVQATGTIGYPSLRMWVEFAGVSLAATPYVMVETSGSGVNQFVLTLGGVPVTVSPVLTRQASGGITLSVLETGGETLTRVDVLTSSFSSSTVTINVHDISRTDTLPQVTKKQTTRVIEVGGTERTPASIHVESTTGDDGHNGLVIVHTSPEDGSGYSPSLRRWRTDASTGPVYVDAGTLSGAWEDINYIAGGFNAKVPTSSLPEGGYVLMARLRSATAGLNTGTLYWSTSTLIGDSVEQQGYTNGSIPIALGSTPVLIPVAALSLPSVRTRTGMVEISLQAITSGAQIQLDEGLLFRADDDCALTIVNNFQDHLWLDSPDTTSSVPRVWIGPSDDNRNHPGSALRAMGNHVLNPDGTAVFTASLSDNPATEATFYRRWHSNAAE